MMYSYSYPGNHCKARQVVVKGIKATQLGGGCVQPYVVLEVGYAANISTSTHKILHRWISLARGIRLKQAQGSCALGRILSTCE